MKNFLTLALSFIALNLFSQDIIKLKTGEEIKAKITVVSDEEIQYKEWDYLDGPDFKMSVKKIEKIVYQSGREQKFEESDLMLGAPSAEVLQRKNVVKFAFLSPLFGRTILGFEHVQRFGLHWEGELGIIGLGKDNNNTNSLGLWISGGPKFMMRKETYMKGERYLHYLHGSYIRPELHVEYYTGDQLISYYSGAPNYIYTTERLNYSTTTFGLMLNLGKQWFVGDCFTLDIYGGLGMASVNTISDNINNNDLVYYSDFGAGSRGLLSPSLNNNGEINFALKGGFKIGYAFK